MTTVEERREAARLLRERAGYEMGCVFKELYGDCNSAGPTCGECNERYGNVFDHEAFEAWLAEVPFPVYISESTQPSGCVEVARRTKVVTMKALSNRKYRAEGIFVQEKFYQQVVDNGA